MTATLPALDVPLYGDHLPALRLWVPGRAAPGGSKRAFLSRTGRMVVKDDCKRNKTWRAHVASVARKAFPGPALDGPLEVWVRFVVARPKGHYGTGKNARRLKPGAAPHPTKKPDVTKLWRATEDALTGIVWIDDAQIVSQSVSKVFGERPGVQLVVSRVETP